MISSSRVNAWVALCCLFCAVAAATIGGLGILGVASVADSEKSLTNDELVTDTATGRLAAQVSRVFATGQRVALGTDDPGVQRRQASSLRNTDVPAVEAALAAVERVHEGDSAAERTEIARLADQWVTLRTVINSDQLTAGPGPVVAARLQAGYQPLSEHLQGLSGRELGDARADQARSSAFVHHIAAGIAVGVLLTAVTFALLGVFASRRLRRAIEPAHTQVEFADTLQLAEDEDEAHRLLQRHLERLVAGSSVTVLNRNNSADRLEAVTALPPGSPLVEALTHAEPRSCLAVRSARVHEEVDEHPGLLSCAVCTTCPGASTCMPLNVGGEVIGSVLINRLGRYKTTERHRVRDAVSQAAPVLANLRNLAIAELRAATDSLTGLPNKRAVADTLNRMMAQASRTGSPLSLLVLDLDHFKAVNDRYGHQVGDQALANVGAALRATLRDSDFAGRNGGEEFAIMLPETDLLGALATAEKIRAAVADIDITGLDVSISASIGVATYPDHALGPERLERLADSALFVAKRSGRNRIEVAALSDDAHQLDAGSRQPSPVAE